MSTKDHQNDLMNDVPILMNDVSLLIEERMLETGKYGNKGTNRSNKRNRTL